MHAYMPEKIKSSSGVVEGLAAFKHFICVSVLYGVARYKVALRSIGFEEPVRPLVFYKTSIAGRE